MNSFLYISLLILFITVPIYYITVVYSIYYKRIFKNKDNLKYSFKTNSLSSYISLIVLCVSTILYCIFAVTLKANFIFIIPMIILDLLVYFSIKLSCTKFCIYTDYVVVKNNYAEFNEIQNILLKGTDKNNQYELQISTKFDLLICKVNTDNPKEFLKHIKTLLPKNIKIKEVPKK